MELPAPEPGVRVEAALNGGALRPVESALDAPQSGDHWLAVASRDAAGNRSPVRFLRVRVDDAPPIVELSTDPTPINGDDGQLWLPPAAHAVAMATDALAGVGHLEISHSVGNERKTSQGDSLRLPLPDNGRVLISATARDRVSHQANAELEVHIDGTGPQGQIQLVGPQTDGTPIVVAPSIRAEAQINDTESGLDSWKAFQDGEETAPEAWQGPWSAGGHTVEAVAVDKVGNESRIGPVGFVVDADGPEIRWRLEGESLSDTNGTVFYRAPVTLDLEAGDAPAGVATIEAAEDGASFAPWAGALLLDVESLRLRATDRVGNVTTETASWNVDRDPPDLSVKVRDTLISPDENVEVAIGEALVLEAKDEVGVAEAMHRIERREDRPGSGGAYRMPTLLRFESAGEWRLTLEATDRFGHQSSMTIQVSVREND